MGVQNKDRELKVSKATLAPLVMLRQIKEIAKMKRAK